MERSFLDDLQVSAEVAEAILAQSQRELEQLRSEQENQLRQMAFDRSVEQAVAAAKGRNVTAIRALLDLQALAGQDDKAVAAAVRNLKREHGYLFEGNQGPVFSPAAGTQVAATVVQETLASALREKYGM